MLRLLPKQSGSLLVPFLLLSMLFSSLLPAGQVFAKSHPTPGNQPTQTAGIHALKAHDETLTAPFVNGPNGATTTNSYSGNVNISVSGTGQASATAYSDAFYVFTDNAGNPITPEHHPDFGLCINSQPVDHYITAIPPYSSNHTYQFTISLSSSQHLTFGVCDTFTADNTGSFIITVTPAPSRTLISDITLSVTPTTPLYQVDLDVHLISNNISCPAKLTVAVGSITSTNADICGETKIAPPDVHVLLPVFNPANSSQDLIPNSSTTATATITDQIGQDQKSVTVFVPPAPVWIGVGDSNTSGWNQSCNFCVVHTYDPAFSWVTEAVASLNSKRHVPPAWQMVAHILPRPTIPLTACITGKPAGITTTEMLATQVPNMKTLLTAHHGSWNVVSVDGGADDIRFACSLFDFYILHRHLTSPDPWNIKDEKTCLDLETNSLYQRLQDDKQTIVSNLNAIVSDAREADQNVSIVVVDYPYVMDTSNVCSSTHKKPVKFIGTSVIVKELDKLASKIKGINTVHVNLLETPPSGFGTSPLPYLQLIKVFGYPHPNPIGQSTIAERAAEKVIRLKS